MSDATQISRREFLRQLHALGERRILAALTEHILPSDDEPGAREAGCAGFVEQQLARPEFAALAQLCRRGLKLVEQQARVMGAVPFAELPSQQQHAVVTKVQHARRPVDGRRFMEIAIVLTLEGFLSDPVHGGNRGEVGWRFAARRPADWAPDDGRTWRKSADEP